MGVPTSEVGYTSATTGREDHEAHVVALGEKKIMYTKNRHTAIHVPRTVRFFRKVAHFS
jgi:hypothetical protein